MLASLAAWSCHRGSAGSVTRRGSTGVPAGSKASTAVGSLAVPSPGWLRSELISTSVSLGGTAGVPAFFAGLASGEGLGGGVAAFFR